jgi:hypothetical protein
MASSLVIGVGIALAVAPKATKLTCHMSLTTAPPYGSNTVSQPAPQGSQYGPVHCGRKTGGGVVADVFTVPDSGDTVGTFTQYFTGGTIRGSFDIAPQEAGPVSLGSFESQAWMGSMKVTGGTGSYNGIKTAREGVLKCASPDSVHLVCTEKVHITGVILR